MCRRYKKPAYESLRERGAELNKTTEKSVGLFQYISLAFGQVLIQMKGLILIVALTKRGTLPPLLRLLYYTEPTIEGPRQDKISCTGTTSTINQPQSPRKNQPRKGPCQMYSVSPHLSRFQKSGTSHHSPLLSVHSVLSHAPKVYNTHVVLIEQIAAIREAAGSNRAPIMAVI
jgi:hypothetical protein